MDAPTSDLVRALRETPTVDDGGTLTGHFAVFNDWTKIDSTFEGRFLERIAPGAFAKTFKENRDAVKVLFNHGNDPTMGDQILGPVGNVVEDERGAFYEVPLFDGLPPLILSGLRAGAYGASFRFRVIPGKDDWEDRPERSETNPEGLPERTVREVQLFEFGPVTFPAYANATAGVRSVSLTDSWMRSRGIPVDLAADLATPVREPASEQEPRQHSGLTHGERARVLRELTLRSV